MALSEDLMSKCSEHLSAYKSACEDHPDLKSFDSSIKQRTNKVIDSLTTGTETGVFSQHAAHMEVSKHLVEVSQDVANFILESEEDVWENKALSSLVHAYFENTMKTAAIFEKVMDFVDKAETGELIITEAVEYYDIEFKEKNVGGKKLKYEKTLKELRKFQEKFKTNDPFDDSELTKQFELMKEQQESLLKEVCDAKEKLKEEVKKIEEELKMIPGEYAKAQKMGIIWNVVFGAAFAIVATVSFVLICSGVGAGAGVGLAALALPTITVGWAGVYTKMENQKKALEEQEKALIKKKKALNKMDEDLTRLKDIASETGKGTETIKVAMDSVSVTVHKLHKMIAHIIEAVDDAIKEPQDEVHIKNQLKSLKEKVKKLTKEIKEVCETVEINSGLIVEARNHVLEKINGSGKYHRV